jgi:hypothetical protein
VKEGNGLLFDVVVFCRVVFLTNCSWANYGRWRKNSVRYTHVESTVVSMPKQMCGHNGTPHTWLSRRTAWPHLTHRHKRCVGSVGALHSYTFL